MAGQREKKEKQKAAEKTLPVKALPSSRVETGRPDSSKWTNLIVRQAMQIAKRIEADAILFYMDSTKDLGLFSKITTNDARLILLSKRKDCAEKAAGLPVSVVVLPDVQLTRIGYLKIGFLGAISKGLIKNGDVVVCVGGVPNRGHMDTIMIVEAGLESELFGGGGETAFPTDIEPEVFETLLDLAVELANEGREGKPVGSIFVLGDHKRVMELSYQLVFNPFQGYSEEVLKLHNRDVQETLKEFSSIDGAFVVREDGVVLSAGRYLNIGYQGDPLPQGLGARHAAAAAITQASDSIALVISESTGKVTVFRGGRILSEIEKSAIHSQSRRALVLE